jgi:putative flavoprotein involved in K+ transport
MASGGGCRPIVTSRRQGIMREIETIDTVVIGGGQAGLSVGYHLARRGVPFVILEANPRVGDSWRNRWDSLRLFSPARFDGLDGWPFPGDPEAFPTKNEMADYLEAYAARFSLPVRTGTRVERVSRAEGGLLVRAGDSRILARHVVVAMANFQRPQLPSFAASIDPGITQLHSSAYRSPAQLAPGAVLVVGLGNSGAEIAQELAAAGRETLVSGRAPGELPFRPGDRIARLGLLWLVFRVLFFRVMTLGTPIGRKLYPRLSAGATPLIRVKQRDLAGRGVRVVGRTTGVRNGRPLTAEGTALDVGNIIWCTGFEPGFSWIDLPVFDGRGRPVQVRGEATAEPALSFVGLHFLYAMSSAMIHGVGRDAAYVAERVAAGRPGRTASAPAEPRRVEAVA